MVNEQMRNSWWYRASAVFIIVLGLSIVAHAIMIRKWSDVVAGMLATFAGLSMLDKRTNPFSLPLLFSAWGTNHLSDGITHKHWLQALLGAFMLIASTLTLVLTAREKRGSQTNN